jgi:TPR repeat protein
MTYLFPSGAGIAAYILAQGLLLTMAVAQQPPTTACDTFAASDQDTNQAAAGVPLDKVDPALAIPACLDALSRYPQNMRFVFQLGRSYQKAEDYAQAAEFYRKAAESGNPLAQNNLAALLKRGQGFPKDEVEAVQWFRKAAEQGLAVAQSNLASMYASGQGVAKDDKQAVNWYRKAAEQGNALAQVNLARMSWQGRALKRTTPRH